MMADAYRSIFPHQWHEVLSAPGYLSVPFDADQQASIWIPANITHACSIDDFSNGCVSVDFPNLPASSSTINAERDFHEDCVQKLVSQIHQKQLSKVILSRQVAVEFNTAETQKAFAHLCQTYEHAYVFWWYTPDSGMWMGATPELLLSGDHQMMNTVALAGTRKSSFAPSTPWSEKEIHEQALVTDYIHEVLNRDGITNIAVNGPFTMNAGSVSHLKTEFSFHCQPTPSHLSQLLKDLHPTPAVCGLPKQKALEAIQHIEPHSRQFYGGFQGETGSNTPAYYVTIRCMQLFKQTAVLFVGGGITAASVPADEWIETELKAQTLLAVLKNM